MKHIVFIILSFFLIISCEQAGTSKITSDTQKIWPTDSIRKYFRDSIAGRMYNGQPGIEVKLNNFDTFSKYVLAHIKAKNIYDPFILGFDENYVDTTQIDSLRKWFRISVNPCFSIPYCIIIEQTGDISRLTLKMTDGYGGYYSGFLNFVSVQHYSDSLYMEVSNNLHELDFWKLNVDTSCGGGLDGQTWTFEAIENGQYNIISRWSPLHCGSNVTNELAELAIKLRNKANFDEYAKFKTKDIRYRNWW